MSSNTVRKTLVAKRRLERPPTTSCGNTGSCPKPGWGDDEDRRGTKRSFKEPLNGGPKKNLASDRMKSLRTKLAEDVIKAPALVKKYNVPKPQQRPTAGRERCKRPLNSWRAAIEETTNSRKKLHTANNNEQAVIKTGLSLPTSEVFRPPQILQSRNPPPSDIFKICGDANIWNNAATISESPNQNSNKPFEEMEWSAIDVLDVSTVPGVVETRDTAAVKEEPTNSQNKNHLFIVMDTNIFISHVGLVKELTEVCLLRCSVPIVFVPWIVIEELDYLKGDSGSKCRWKAQEAIKFINNALESKKGRIIGQTLAEVGSQRDIGKSPDDKIIACCLQVMENHDNMILLTNDVNLKNKALINSIPTCSHSEIMSKISPKADTGVKSRQILEKMVVLCSAVIRACAVRAYGKNWNKMGLLDSAPKSMQDCIKIFKKYWIAVFEELLLKQFRNAIDDFASFLAKNNKFLDSQIGKLSDLSIRVCIFLKDVEHCKNLVESTIREIAQIKDS